MARFLASRLRSRSAFERVLRERLSEPIHLNILSAFVAIFGSYQAKVYWDLKFRQYTAFCLLDAARRAADLGINRISAVEFGVATGAGLLNICEIAAQTTKSTGVDFEIFGFDTGEGLPPPQSYRDHPELYQSGDFPMMEIAALEAKLPANARLVLGDIAETVPRFVDNGLHAPLGYVALDVDYHWSAAAALQILGGPPEQYMPLVNIYLDDCHESYHNPSCGEMLACEEFNTREMFRKIHPYTALREKRLLKNASWISKIWALHVLDHPVRTEGVKRPAAMITNPYLNHH